MADETDALALLVDEALVLDCNEENPEDTSSPAGGETTYIDQFLRDPVKPLYKTTLCKHFMKKGFCVYGEQCRFAHGEDELRLKPYIRNYRLVPCRYLFEQGYCPYGQNCNFSHDPNKHHKLQNLFSDMSAKQASSCCFVPEKRTEGSRLNVFKDITTA